MDQNPENFVISFLNMFRVTPEEAGIELDKATDHLSTADKSKLDEFHYKLISMNPMKPFKVSTSLTKAAEDKMALIKAGKEEQEKDKWLRINKHVVGYGDIYEMVHYGGLDRFCAEIFFSPKDPLRTNRDQIFNEHNNYIGAAVDKAEDGKNQHFVIILADRVIEENTKPLDQQILEAINEFRKIPIRKAEELKSLPGSRDYRDGVSKFAERLSTKPLVQMERSKELDEVALNVFEKIQSKEYNDPSDETKLAEIANNTIHNFNRIHFACIKNAKTVKEIINSILANPKEKEAVLMNTRKVINGKAMKYLGVYYAGHGEKENIMVLVSVDEYYAGSKKDYSVYFNEEINRLRLNPSSYRNDLEVFRKEIKIKTYKQPLIQEINSLRDNLKTLEPSKPIENHQLLNQIAQDYMFQIGKGRVFNEEEDFLLQRLSLEVSGVKKAKLFVNNTVSRPENFITSLLVSENDSDRESRKALMSNDYKFFGCYYELRGEEKISILVLADNVEFKEFKQPHEEILDRINVLRQNPRTLIKFIAEYESELYEKLKSAEQNTLSSKRKAVNNSKMQKLQEQLAFCYELKEYLYTAKIMPKLEVCPDIGEAIKDRFNTNEPATVLNQNDLREYLKEYVNNTFYCGMFAGVVTPEMFIKSEKRDTETSEGENLNAGKFNSGAFLARLIIDEANFNTINNIFGFPFRYTNIQFDLETDIVIGFFVDHAVEKTVIEVPLDIRQKVKRPQFTQDELEQMRNDFNRLDILGAGFVRPDTILTFMHSSMRFVNNNPVYYHAFKLLNTVENNELGVNVNQFMDSVTDVIAKFTRQNWETVFSLLTTDSTKRKFDKEMFVEILQKLGYKIHKSEAEDMFDRFALEKPNITREEFVRMMFMSEKGIFNYKEDEE